MQFSQFLQTSRSLKTSAMDMNMMNSVKSYPQSTAAYLISAGKMDCGIWEIVSLYLGLEPYARTCFDSHMTPLDTSVLKSLTPTSETATTGRTCAGTSKVHTFQPALTANVTKAAQQKSRDHYTRYLYQMRVVILCAWTSWDLFLKMKARTASSQ
jgi:hypothetical protein